jgi:hypothetical protein
MKTTYTVHAGPHYPPAIKVSPLADFVLVANAGGLPEVLLALTVPARYKGGWRTRKLNEFKVELETYARQLNGKMVPKARQKLLAKLAAERAVQLNVEALLSPKKPTPRPANFGADFGNLTVGERQGSFSPVGRLDGVW